MENMKKLVVAWDLDGTLIDSSHRISFKEDGSFDLDYWIEKAKQRNYVMNDKLLPLVNVYREFRKTGFTQICVTARAMSELDFEYLEKNDLKFDLILHRKDEIELDEVLKDRKLQDFFSKEGRIPFMAYDDKNENLAIFNKHGFRTFQAAYLNKVLQVSARHEIDFAPADF